jgi:NADH-quinone oxidoreductase subunit A
MWQTPESLQYVPVLALVAISLALGCLLLLVHHLLSKRVPKARQTTNKFDVYECGVPPVGSGHQQFSVRYYLVGIVFLLFDVEVVFMYPWAVVYRQYLGVGAFILLEMAVFLAILFAGYVYLLRREVLQWD